MTIVWARETWSGRDGDTSESGVRNYMRTFLVKTDDKTDSAYDLLTSGSLPDVGDVHPDDIGAWCTSVKPRNVGATPFFWNVTVSYSSDKELNDDPLLDDPDISWGSQKFQEPIVDDINGDAVVNSAGDPFDPPIMRDVSREVVTITANVASVPAWVFSYKDRLNNATITIDGISILAEKAKCDDITVANKAERNEIEYYPLTIRLSLREEGWAKQVLDVGFNEIDGSAGRAAILLDDGTEPKSPVPLDGNGQRLSNPTTETAVILSFDIYPQVDFTVFPGIS